jgi:hypothetical protein
MLDSTNVSWQAELVPPSLAGEREQLATIHDFTTAQGALGIHIVKNNIGTYALLSFKGVLRTLLMPPWQEFMRMTMPDVDAAELAANVVGRNWSKLSKLGTVRVCAAIAAAALMALYAVLVCVAAFAGWFMLLRRQWDSIVVWSLFLFPAYFLAVAGPNAVSRFRIALLPFMLPCAAIAVVALVRLSGRRTRRPC